MIDMNNFVKLYTKDPVMSKAAIVNKVFESILDAVHQNYYEFKDLKELNYSEICDWCGFPDFQDNGIFEQCIDIAADAVLRILGYKPQHV